MVLLLAPRQGGRRDAAGLTLVEVVLAIVILGLTVPVLLTLAGSVAPPFFQAEAMSRALQLAHALESEVISQRFDELLEKSGLNWSATLGPDAGEMDRSMYDDVDDFHGFSETLIGVFSGYTRSVSVVYATNLGPYLIGDAVSKFSENSYKRITLRVIGPVGVDLSYSILATPANSQGAPAP